MHPVRNKTKYKKNPIGIELLNLLEHKHEI